MRQNNVQTYHMGVINIIRACGIFGLKVLTYVDFYVKRLTLLNCELCPVVYACE